MSHPLASVASLAGLADLGTPDDVGWLAELTCDPPATGIQPPRERGRVAHGTAASGDGKAEPNGSEPAKSNRDAMGGGQLRSSSPPAPHAGAAQLSQAQAAQGVIHDGHRSRGHFPFRHQRRQQQTAAAGRLRNRLEEPRVTVRDASSAAGPPSPLCYSGCSLCVSRPPVRLLACPLAAMDTTTAAPLRTHKTRQLLAAMPATAARCVRSS